MFIKKYCGKDADLLQHQILEELGPYAVVLVMRTVEPSFFQQFFKETEYEITVGVEPEEYYRHQTDMKNIQAGQILKKEEIPAESPLAKALEPTLFPMSSLSWGNTETEQMEIAVSGPLKFDTSKKNLVTFVGPDAVDKAAVVTKIAIKLQKETPCKVAVIAMCSEDNDLSTQLKGFACLFRLLYEKVADVFQFEQFIKKNQGYQILFVATSSSQSIQNMKSMIQKVPNSKVLLVLSAGSSLENQLQLIQQYQDLNLFGLIYTQFELNPSLLFLEEICKRQKVPISYLMEGSDVKVANADDIETRIINEKLRAISTTW